MAKASTARNPYEGTQAVERAILRAHDKYARLAREQLSFDPMALVNRIFGEQHEKFLSVMEDRRFASMFSHKNRFEYDGVERNKWCTVVVPFTGERAYFTSPPSPFCTFQRYVAKRGRNPQPKGPNPIYIRGLALRIHYPEGTELYHRHHHADYNDARFVEARHAFYATPRSLGGAEIYEALVQRLKPLYDLSERLHWQSGFAKHILGKLYTPGQCMRVWPECTQFMNASHADACRKTRAAPYPKPLLEQMLRKNITRTYIETVLREVTDSVLSCELVSFDDAEEVSDGARIGSYAAVWVHSEPVEINS